MSTQNSSMKSAGVWYRGHFLTNFCYYLLLPFTLLLLVVLLTSPISRLGEDFGIAKLVWHGECLKQVVVGIAFAVIWVQVLFVGYLLWLHDRREGIHGEEDQATEQPAPFRSYSCWITLCFLATVAVTDPELLLDDPRDAGAGPDLPAEAIPPPDSPEFFRFSEEFGVFRASIHADLCTYPRKNQVFGVPF